jgi:hypothetical protein
VGRGKKEEAKEELDHSPEDAKKIDLHGPWPFQDGPLSETLECRAS